MVADWNRWAHTAQAHTYMWPRWRSIRNTDDDDDDVKVHTEYNAAYGRMPGALSHIVHCRLYHCYYWICVIPFYRCPISISLCSFTYYYDCAWNNIQHCCSNTEENMIWCWLCAVRAGWRGGIVHTHVKVMFAFIR